MLFHLLAMPLAASLVAAGVPYPHQADVLAPRVLSRGVLSGDVTAGQFHQLSRLERRGDHNKTFDLGFQAQDVALFSA
jgi:hypothetical protein